MGMQTDLTGLKADAHGLGREFDLRHLHNAGIVQMVERLLCKQHVMGSKPFASSKRISPLRSTVALIETVPSFAE